MRRGQHRAGRKSRTFKHGGQTLALDRLVRSPAAAAFAVILQILVMRATPILKGRIIDTLSTRFNSRVELDTLKVTVLQGLDITGAGLRIDAPDDVVAAGAVAPLIAIDQFQFHAGLLGLFFKPTHVDSVHVRGLAINIPPRKMRRGDFSRPQRPGKTEIEVDEILCDDSRLVIGTEKPDKGPKIFELHNVAFTDVGPNAPWPTMPS